MVTLPTCVMFLLFTCMHIWVWGTLRTWSTCVPTAYEVVRDCRKLEIQWTQNNWELRKVTVSREKRWKEQGGSAMASSLSMYSITENIYYSQLPSVAILLQPEPNCFTSCSTSKWLCSFSLCAIILRSPSHVPTCNGQRSSQLFCVHYTAIFFAAASTSDIGLTQTPIQMAQRDPSSETNRSERRDHHHLVKAIPQHTY
jgi:hypothetical protein